MQALFLILLFILGACFGSFLCCQARRLHLATGKQTKKTASKQKPAKSASAKVSRRSSVASVKASRGHSSKKAAPAKAFSKTASRSVDLGPRSVCLHCKYQLKWYDNLPIVSWLFLSGKCRRCHKKIGLAEFLAELLTAIAWLALGLAFIGNHAVRALNPLGPLPSFSMLDWSIFLTTLLLTLPLIFLSIYDGLYGELPTKILYLSIGLALVVAVLRGLDLLQFRAVYANIILNPLAAVMILSGIYLLLYLISKGKWVGDGDWLLALALALALAHPWLALVTLFVSNALATLVSLPLLKRNQSHKIHFGPYLVAAFIIVTIFATPLMSILS